MSAVNEATRFAAYDWVWRLLTAAVLTWYISVTGYVAVKGLADIRTMLDRLAQRK